MLKLYANIKRFRLAAKMTQDELARRVGYTDRSSIAKVEKGAVDLSQTKIKQFADALGTTPGHLLGWEQSPEELGEVAAEVLMDPETLTLVQNYLSLSETDKSMVRSLVDSLATKTKKRLT